MTTNASLAARRAAAVPIGVGSATAVYAAHAENVELWDVEGRRYVEELRTRNDELERFNRVSTGRELRMIELKKQVNELCAKAGLPKQYEVEFESG